MTEEIYKQKPYLLTLFVFFGALCVVLFHEGLFIPIPVSASVLVLASICVFKLYRESRIGPLTMLLFVAFVLPFIHVFPYLWFDFERESPASLWGFVANPYMTDKSTIELLSMIGAVGATGFVIGALLLRKKLSLHSPAPLIERYKMSGKTLSIPVFVAWVSIAIVLSWLSAPSDLVFDSAYTQSVAISTRWSFSAAWMISYACLVFAFADSMFEVSPRVGKLKRKMVLAAILLIVVWFQLLRGDRESLPFVLSVLLMYFAWGKHLHISSQMKIKWSIVVPIATVVVVASFLVGALRHSLVDVSTISEFLFVLTDLYDAGVIHVHDLISGTWSAALLTPLSVAGDYINGSLPLKYGQDYLNLLASLIPGFVADWIGYTRPLDALHGPAWEMTYGLGGTHAVVVPFIDFRMAGALLIVALWTFAIGKLEHYAVEQLTVHHLSLLGIVALAIPHWLWYGEKYIINALVIWAILSFAYRLRMYEGGHDSRPESREPATNR